MDLYIDNISVENNLKGAVCVLDLYDLEGNRKKFTSSIFPSTYLAQKYKEKIVETFFSGAQDRFYAYRCQITPLSFEPIYVKDKIILLQNELGTINREDVQKNLLHNDIVKEIIASI